MKNSQNTFFRNLFLVANALLIHFAQAENFAWQKDYAKVLPTGDLEWAPESYVFEPEGEVRYIDYENGSDANDGSKTAPWKHHPWDAKATGKAKSGRADTFVFKGGTVYRGKLKVPQGASAVLTRDPSWGEGHAWIYGSQPATGWERRSHPKIPDGGKVWAADLDFLPRYVWAVDARGNIAELEFAREPDWEVSDPENYMSEWRKWNQPEWFKRFQGKDPHTIMVKGKRFHVGRDAEFINQWGEELVGGWVRTEWGVPTGGEPYFAQIQAYNKEEGGIAFGGAWFEGAGGFLINKHRYYLAGLPMFLDEAGEYWFERRGDGGTLYVRLPGDANPDDFTVEAAKELRLIDAGDVGKLRISGLGFRFVNVMWNLGEVEFGDPDVLTGVVRVWGNAEEVQLNHNRFEHVTLGVRIEAGDNQTISKVVLRDNYVIHADQGAFDVADRRRDRSKRVQGRLIEAQVLRNRIQETSFRTARGRYSPAIRVRCPWVGHYAGNIVNRVGAQGLDIFGGKLSGDEGEWPFSRQVIHQNHVVDSLMIASDWAGIEMWQGGPFYVFNNNSGAPHGMLSWQGKEGQRFGFPFYHDGAFKSFTFNNIAWARTDNESEKYGSKAAFQTVLSYEISYVNNSIYNYRYGWHRQSPGGANDAYLGNIVQDVSVSAMEHAKPAKDQDAVNITHFEAAKEADYFTNAYARNVFWEAPVIGTYIIEGEQHDTLEGFQADLDGAGYTGGQPVGIMAKSAPMPMASEGDFRPAKNSGVGIGGIKQFMPWALYAVVGEWNFTPNNKQPDLIVDEHWFMTEAYDKRDNYHETPRYHLVRSGGEFIDGPLENWTTGALALDGNSHLKVTQETLAEPYTIPKGKGKGGRASQTLTDLPTVDMDKNSFSIEAVVRVDNPDATVVAKIKGGTGYLVDVTAGNLRISLMDDAGGKLIATGPAIADGAWRHLFIEVDRDNGLNAFINGETAQLKIEGSMPRGSLSNQGDFLVGGGNDLPGLKGAFEFLRLSRGTLADAFTTIKELYAWQFHGPFLKDFTGKPRDFQNGAVGALEF